MIDYQKLIDEAMLSIVKNVLRDHVVQEAGMQPFYISFYTPHPGVKLSAQMKKQYPTDITIVLENQFDNLQVEDDHFTVDVSFGGVSENIRVPFAAMTSFVDPVASFTLQLSQGFDEEEVGHTAPVLHACEDEEEYTAPLSKDKTKRKKSTKDEEQLGEVVDFNAFRKKEK